VSFVCATEFGPRPGKVLARAYCHWLVTYGIPVRDIAELLDISPQRVSHLAND
jgi:hypothetical protein